MCNSSLKDRILSLRASMALRKNKTQRSSISLKEAKSIGILCDSIHETHIKDSWNVLAKNKDLITHAEFICIYDNRATTISSTIHPHCISYNDVSFTGNIKNSTITNFINHPFDYLIYLNLNTSPLTKLLLAKSKARCRVGIYDEKLAYYYDFMIKLNENTDQSIEIVFEKVFSYLNLIKN
jgi:hypothetical protein